MVTGDQLRMMGAGLFHERVCIVQLVATMCIGESVLSQLTNSSESVLHGVEINSGFQTSVDVAQSSLNALQC